MTDQLKFKRKSKNLAIAYKNVIENHDKLNSLSMHGNNAAETMHQLEFHLGSITAKTDDVLGLAKNYFEIKTQEDQVATARTPTLSKSVRSKKRFHSVLRLHHWLRVSVEERQPLQKSDAMNLNAGLEIQIQSMKNQLEIDVVVEESRQTLAEATIEEAEYLEDASEICRLFRSMSKLTMAVQENQTEEVKKLGKHLICSSRNYSAPGASPKRQPGTCFRILVFFRYWTTFVENWRWFTALSQMLIISKPRVYTHRVLTSLIHQIQVSAYQIQMWIIRMSHKNSYLWPTYTATTVWCTVVFISLISRNFNYVAQPSNVQPVPNRGTVFLCR